MALRAEGLGLAYVGNAVGADDVAIDLVAEEAIEQSVARVSVVIPTLNEARNLPHVLERIPDWIDEVLIHVRALRASLKVSEVPSFESKRIHGNSNLRTIQDGWRVLRSIVTEWFEHRLGTGAPQPLLVDRLPGARPSTPPFSHEAG